MRRNYREKGFTLIELLIVIVIIGILAGVVIAVMNPAEQQRRARESVVRSNTDKICLAMHACAAARQAPATSCITFANVGVNDPAGTPTGSTYTISYSDPDITVAGEDSAGCEFSCTYDVTDGTATQVAPVVPADCLTD